MHWTMFIRMNADQRKVLYLAAFSTGHSEAVHGILHPFWFQKRLEETGEGPRKSCRKRPSVRVL